MKNKTRLATTIFLGITIFVTLGCQLASKATPAPISISESTPTQAPEPDISSAVLTLEDLPAGFEEISTDEIGITEADFSEEALQPEEIFIFLNSENFQMVFGFNFLLTKTLDRAAFDVAISQPEISLPAMVNGMGSENVQDEKIIDGFEDIGDAQVGMTMITNMEGVPVRVDVLMFRRDVIGVMVMSMVLDGGDPNITLHDLGLKLDQIIQGSLQP